MAELTTKRLPTVDVKILLGVSSPAKPTLLRPLPISRTRAGISSSSDIVMQDLTWQRGKETGQGHVSHRRRTSHCGSSPVNEVKRQGKGRYLIIVEHRTVGSHLTTRSREVLVETKTDDFISPTGPLFTR